ncbi:MAG: electron transfer flavoprotein subunit alpha/FixB family protein [Fusobacteriaceae bacterium]
MDILIYVDYENEVISDVTFELIGEAKRLIGESNSKIYALIIGNNLSEFAKELTYYDLENIFVYENKEFEFYREDIYSTLFEDCIKKINPSIVLIPGTDIGKSIAPVIATRFNTGLTADCTQLFIDEKFNLIQIRPAFGGNIMAQIITPDCRPQFTTIRPKIMEKAKMSKFEKNNIEKVSTNNLNLKSAIEILEVFKIEKKENILESKILIVAGNGFKYKEDLFLLNELAELLEAKICSSRALVEKHWMPNELQIGLSGKSVSPEIIITFGVSGSVQFRAGMEKSKKIIAINNNIDADIFQIAHVPICGNLYEIIPLLIKNIKEGCF